jgi:type IV pilus biogenesis protein CpaD/CtpE
MSGTGRQAKRAAFLLLFGTTTAGIGYCGDEYFYRYRAHTDRVTSGAGNAAASNIAAQMVDPWPASSRRNRINQDGKRAHIAVKRYESNTSITPRSEGTSVLPRPYPNEAVGNGNK